MRFCPVCANVLGIQNGLESMRFYCQTCPYVHAIKHTISSKTELQRKQVDDVLGGASAWENVDATEAVCPKCDHRRAYFMQIQIRSADEPMSTFYKCCKCEHQWREG